MLELDETGDGESVHTFRFNVSCRPSAYNHSDSLTIGSAVEDGKSPHVLSSQGGLGSPRTSGSVECVVPGDQLQS